MSTAELTPAHKGQLAKQCERCLHLWYRGELASSNQCGREAVRQNRCVDARDVTGDCGPKGKYFEEALY